MPDNVYIQLPILIQDLYTCVRDLPVGPAVSPSPRRNAHSSTDTPKERPSAQS